MTNNIKSKARKLLEQRIDELGAIYEKKEAEHKIMEHKILVLKKELAKLTNDENGVNDVHSINMNKYIKSMRG